MAIRNLRYEGDEILTKVSREVEEVNDKIRELMDDMIETMHKYNGVGLAAPQVGVLKRVIVIDLYEEGTQYKLVNPVIIKQKGDQECEEGCLSFPNQFGKVVRHKKVKVKALDLDGKKVTLEAEDLLAQALQHEIDHLDGELFKGKILPGTFEVIEQQQNPEEKK